MSIGIHAFVSDAMNPLVCGWCGREEANETYHGEPAPLAEPARGEHQPNEKCDCGSFFWEHGVHGVWHSFRPIAQPKPLEPSRETEKAGDPSCAKWDGVPEFVPVWPRVRHPAEPLAEPKLEELPCKLENEWCSVHGQWRAGYCKAVAADLDTMIDALGNDNVAIRGERDHFHAHYDAAMQSWNQALDELIPLRARADSYVRTEDYDSLLSAYRAQQELLRAREWVEIKRGCKLPEPETLCLIITNEPAMKLASMGGYQDTFWEEGRSDGIPASCVHKFQIVAPPINDDETGASK